jgi:hypothetical protein
LILPFYICIQRFSFDSYGIIIFYGY